MLILAFFILQFTKSYSEQSEHERSELLAKQVTHAVSVSKANVRSTWRSLLAKQVIHVVNVSLSELSEAKLRSS